MPKSKSQRMKEYRARKKAKLGEEWLKQERQRIRGYFPPTEELTEVQKEERRQRHRKASKAYYDKHKKKVKVETGDNWEGNEALADSNTDMNSADVAVNVGIDAKLVGAGSGDDLSSQGRSIKNKFPRTSRNFLTVKMSFHKSNRPKYDIPVP